MTDNADITIFNQIIGADRREVFVPTMISGAFWYDVRSMSQSDRHREGSSRVIIRIPYDAEIQDNRIYLPEEQFKKLKGEELEKYWTIQKNAYVLKRHIIPDEINRLRAEEEDFFTVVEYADNTLRGSDCMKHWRIGGA